MKFIALISATTQKTVNAIEMGVTESAKLTH